MRSAGSDRIQARGVSPWGHSPTCLCTLRSTYNYNYKDAGEYLYYLYAHVMGTCNLLFYLNSKQYRPTSIQDSSTWVEPTLTPCAAKKVNAILPPIKTLSACDRFWSHFLWLHVDCLAPYCVVFNSSASFQKSYLGLNLLHCNH